MRASHTHRARSHGTVITLARLRTIMNGPSANLEPQTPRNGSPHAICESVLAELCAGNPDIGFAVISTKDARVVSHRAHAQIDPSRLAAMTSSIIAICESLSQEFDGGSCQSVSLTMSEYTCVIAHIPAAKHPLALAIGMRAQVLLARARRLTLDVAERVAASLNAPAEETGRRHLHPPT
ncbi:roadblock/LC7 domain-containing protein [Dyella sp. 2RAB6]|uniref:roadblock/LC7 domain-containing protein n=1 Tax=Dyella sp. 2RAB6 TaxID=3232992 RepID=UPI003F93DE46